MDIAWKMPGVHSHVSYDDQNEQIDNFGLYVPN